MRLLFIGALIFLMDSGCGESTTVKTPPTADTVAAVTIPAISPGTLQKRTATDGSTFELYVPVGYDAKQSHAVVLFFDPHAAGQVPLNLYKQFADRYQVVFAGSDVSQNGLPLQTVASHTAAVRQVLFELLQADASRLILCGFSGGARVACALALQSDVAGVIACSAAPQQALPAQMPFSGCTGTGDMNYLEMRNYFGALPLASAPTGLYLFNGGHQWPPAATFELALNALLLADTATGVVSASNYAVQVAVVADSLRKTDCDLAADLLNTATHTLARWPQQQKLLLKPVLQAVPKSNCAQQAAARRAETEMREKALQTEIADAILSRDTTWWRSNAPRFFETSATGAEAAMRERLRGYASLMCYSYSGQALKSSNPHGADKLVTVYSIVDPLNSEWAWMRAQLSAQLGLTDLAFEALNRAAALGFTDKARAETDPALASLRSDQRWVAFITLIAQH